MPIIGMLTPQEHLFHIRTWTWHPAPQYNHLGPLVWNNAACLFVQQLHDLLCN